MQVKERAKELAKAMKNEDGVTGAVKAFYKHYPRQASVCEAKRKSVTPAHKKNFCIGGCFGFSKSSR